MLFEIAQNTWRVHVWWQRSFILHMRVVLWVVVLKPLPAQHTPLPAVRRFNEAHISHSFHHLIGLTTVNLELHTLCFHCKISYF